MSVPTWEFLKEHWPEIGSWIDDSSWLVCRCGWDSQESKLDWLEHLQAAATSTEQQDRVTETEE